ncbi:winged helix DNA-binding domain-containing protein [Paenibacillus piri]|uniref:Winged helix DNA-binding domain-containing protein n=2 Tax=Paenibacillus piri TaxID=2547395 RepID=A0A4R5KXY4_9BACL|nr:winged helix DNA-binding domain-containing protein [Paenibacillus piri]
MKSDPAVNSKRGKPDRILGPRELNRALLARQFLIQRARLSVADALEHLIGLQSQAPLPPYIGLWTRLDGFTHDSLSRLMLNRDAVRIALMRSTIFLVTARDCLALRPLLQPVLDRGFKGNHGRKLAGADPHAAAAVGRELVEEQPRTFNELGQLLQSRWSEADPAALAAAVRTLVPLVQIPPRGIWGQGGQAMHTSAEHWLGKPLAADVEIDALMLRYLRAFGPATAADMQVWSGLTRIREVTERLRPQLRTFADPNGNELFDVPDAALPDPNMPVPVRYLAEFDNMLLSYQDRSRIIADEDRKRVFTVNGIIHATFLVDGFVHGIWSIERQKNEAVLMIEPFKPLAPNEKEALIEEGAKLLDFAAADAGDRDIRFSPPA